MSTFFEAKKILVVGGSGVLGAALAREFRAAGAAVSLVTRASSTLPSDLRDLPCARADVRDRDALRAAFAELGGRADGVVNAVGVVAFGAVTDVPADVVLELFRVNALGTVNVLAAGAEVLSEGGFVASLTGVAADVAVLNMSAYCASKSAAHAAMAVAAREWRSKKITVLDVRAPHTETGLVERALWGQAPKMPLGLTPEVVAARIRTALENGERDLPADAFAT
ncbi:MAG: SDR family NAD(P)-dependent oxidoreductase [Acidobacteriota bacterium]|nr:SDR family NAD(P)-dependent oxidoreductase [Acidobacteriota bacterium]MDE3043992.1 SDR family NAD(P)-dependent oxidoreductase [Acidobacteriota bacterium]MDE3107903.1 SDR family NAD(P)-dependent oxidoreductase [Acidobacteriota bacterium]MDE3222387.1 SDR family NAD(P)-dependent oxidoreductase [Acidobacteriota bacterium]